MLEAETDLESLLNEGRLAGIFCRLNVERFTGLLSVEHAEQTTVFTLVDGRPVLAEGSDPGDSVAESFLKAGFVNREQYARIVSRMTESLVDSEDMVFCREAVAIGAVSQEQVDEELSLRLRTKVVQSIGWEDCYVELEEDPDLAQDMPREGEAVGALILTGVRTFYFEQELARELGKLRYARLTLEPEVAAAFFELDAADRRVVEALDGRRPYAQIARRIGADEFSTQQLLCALNYAGCIELASQAFVHANALESGRIAAEVPEPEPSEPPAAQPVASRAASAPTRGAPPDALAEHLKAYMSDQPAPSATPAGRGQIASRAAQSQTERSTSYRSRVQAQQASAPPSRPATAPRTSAPPRHSSQPSTPRPRTAGAPVRERANRKLGAIQRLGKELQNRREPTPSRAPQAREPSTALKSLVLNRRRAAAPTQAVTPRSVDAADAFRQAMELLKGEHWTRALALLTQACEADAANMPYRMHMLWASFKSTPQPSPEVMQDLRNAARDQLESEDNRGFAYYYLGHLALHAKKDESAEKLFRKALTRDKNNKDAERHLRILERRREHAAKAKKGNKVFGIELTLTRSKPDDE